MILQIQITVRVCDEGQMGAFSTLSLQIPAIAFKKDFAGLEPDRDAWWFLKCTGSDSPSLLLQEKPKQRRKTNTKEIHIMATDALADLVKSGGSPENKQWQESKGRNLKLNEDLRNDYRVTCIEFCFSSTSGDRFVLKSYL